MLSSGCSSITERYTQQDIQQQQLYMDEAFPLFNNVYIESQEEIFALDDEMRAMVNYVLKGVKDQEEKAKLLLTYIFSSNHIAMSYESHANVTAIDAFHGRKANCMSLTIMAYALGKEAGMSLKFQDIDVPEYWVRNGSYQMVMGHVNLLVVKRPVNTLQFEFSREILQIDFDPNAIRQSFKRKVVGKESVTAMFYNNKAAQAMIDKDFNTAYAYLRAATQIAPEFSSAWGNLGILYKMKGFNDLAVNTYKHTLRLSPNDLTALENLSLLFVKLGETAEATQIQRSLHEKRISNPYYHALLADEADYKGKPEKAIKHLKKAIKLQGKLHEFYYDLAKLYYKTEQINLAQSAMKKALKLNKNHSTEVKYNQKLNFLNQASLRY
jgi:tetratricopeptide (TPR) repeat protein